MAITVTSLAAAFDANGLYFQATSVTGATVGGFAKVDNEYMVITDIQSPLIFVRSRGDEGGVAIAHDVLAPVVFGLQTDKALVGSSEFVPTPGEDRDVYTVGQNGTLLAPTRDTIYNLTKGSALSATTLAAPSKAQDGLRIVIQACTAFAHVVTATGLIDDGVTGGAKTTLTFGAFVGACIELQAYNGHWMVMNKNVCVIT